MVDLGAFRKGCLFFCAIKIVFFFEFLSVFTIFAAKFN